MNKDMELELAALGEEMSHKKQAIIDEWKKHNSPPYGYGIIEPAKQKAIDIEECNLMKQIIERYKQKNAP